MGQVRESGEAEMDVALLLEHIFGNIFEQIFEHIFEHITFQELLDSRFQILSASRSPEGCCTCFKTSDSKSISFSRKFLISYDL